MILLVRDVLLCCDDCHKVHRIQPSEFKEHGMSSTLDDSSSMFVHSRTCECVNTDPCFGHIELEIEVVASNGRITSVIPVGLNNTVEDVSRHFIYNIVEAIARHFI